MKAPFLCQNSCRCVRQPLACFRILVFGSHHFSSVYKSIESCFPHNILEGKVNVLVLLLACPYLVLVDVVLYQVDTISVQYPERELVAVVSASMWFLVAVRVDSFPKGQKSCVASEDS
jgi:hypothetical protein